MLPGIVIGLDTEVNFHWEKSRARKKIKFGVILVYNYINLKRWRDKVFL